MNIKTKFINETMTDKKPQSIDEYISGFPAEIQKILTKLRETVKKAAPNTTEAISYMMPTFKLNGKNLVHFAAFKNHIGFYPTPGGFIGFEKELAPYAKSKGTVQFQLNEPIPYDLVTKIVKARVEEFSKNKSSGYK